MKTLLSFYSYKNKSPNKIKTCILETSTEQSSVKSIVTTVSITWSAAKGIRCCWDSLPAIIKDSSKTVFRQPQFIRFVYQSEKDIKRNQQIQHISPELWNAVKVVIPWYFIEYIPFMSALGHNEPDCRCHICVLRYSTSASGSTWHWATRQHLAWFL